MKPRSMAPSDIAVGICFANKIACEIVPRIMAHRSARQMKCVCVASVGTEASEAHVSPTQKSNLYAKISAIANGLRAIAHEHDSCERDDSPASGYIVASRRCEPKWRSERRNIYVYIETNNEPIRWLVLLLINDNMFSVKYAQITCVYNNTCPLVFCRLFFSSVVTHRREPGPRYICGRTACEGPNVPVSRRCRRRRRRRQTTHKTIFRKIVYESREPVLPTTLIALAAISVRLLNYDRVKNISISFNK